MRDSKSRDTRPDPPRLTRRELGQLAGSAAIGAGLLGGATRCAKETATTPDAGQPSQAVVDYQTRQPNILMITTDQEHAPRWFTNAETGKPFAEKDFWDWLPARTWLRKAGIDFTNAHVVTMPCSPSRASLYSGLHPLEHNLHGNIGGSSDKGLHDFPTIARVLKHCFGYETHYLGKCHLAQMGGYACEGARENGMAPYGFDRWVGAAQNGPSLSKLDHTDGPSTAKTVEEEKEEQHSCNPDEVAIGDDSGEEPLVGKCYDSPGIPNEGGREDVHFAEQAGEWLDAFVPQGAAVPVQANAGRLANGIEWKRPWLCSMNLVNPHDIAMFYVLARRFQRSTEEDVLLANQGKLSAAYVAKNHQIPSFVVDKDEEHNLPNPGLLSVPDQFSLDNYEPFDLLDRYKPRCQTLYRIYFNFVPLGPMPPTYVNPGSWTDIDWFPEEQKDLPFDLWEEATQYYLQLISTSDRRLAYVLQHLIKLPPEVLYNTVLVFTADHGEKLGAHGLRGKGCSVYEEEIHVPLHVCDFRHPDVQAAVEKLKQALADVPDAERPEVKFFEELLAKNPPVPGAGSGTAPVERAPLVGTIGEERHNLVSHLDLTATIGAIAAGDDAWKDTDASGRPLDNRVQQRVLFRPGESGQTPIWWQDPSNTPQMQAEQADPAEAYRFGSHQWPYDETVFPPSKNEQEPSDGYQTHSRDWIFVGADHMHGRSLRPLLKTAKDDWACGQIGYREELVDGEVRLLRDDANIDNLKAYRRTILTSSMWNWDAHGLGTYTPDDILEDGIRDPYRVVSLREQWLKEGTDGEWTVLRDYKLNLYYSWIDEDDLQHSELWLGNADKTGPAMDLLAPLEVELYDLRAANPKRGHGPEKPTLARGEIEVENLLPVDYAAAFPKKTTPDADTVVDPKTGETEGAALTHWQVEGTGLLPGIIKKKELKKKVGKDLNGQLHETNGTYSLAERVYASKLYVELRNNLQAQAAEEMQTVLQSALATAAKPAGTPAIGVTIKPVESTKLDPKDYASSEDPLTSLQQKAWNMWRSHGSGSCGGPSKLVNLTPGSPMPDEIPIPLECI